MSSQIVEESLVVGDAPKADEINISSLDDSVVYIRLPVGKKLLAENSSVFERQFCGPLRTKTLDGDIEYLDLDDFSPKACRGFHGYISGDSLYFACFARECEVTLEMYRLADKYDIVKLKEELEYYIENLKIPDKDVFIVVDAALKNIHLDPLAKVCSKLLRKCAQTVHYQQIEFIKLWKESGVDNNQALLALNEELEKLKGFRSEAILHFEVENISELKVNQRDYSEVCTIRNAPWNLMIERKEDSLGCYVNCGRKWEKESKWTCNAKVEISMLNQKGGENITRQTSRDFSATMKGIGYHSFKKWSDMINPRNGYVKFDTVIFEAEVKAGIPEGISLEDKDQMEQELCKNCQVFPCLDGHPVKDTCAWEGLKVERKLISKQTVHGIRKEKEGQFTFPIRSKGLKYYLSLQEVSNQPSDEILTYSCK